MTNTRTGTDSNKKYFNGTNNNGLHQSKSRHGHVDSLKNKLISCATTTTTLILVYCTSSSLSSSSNNDIFFQKTLAFTPQSMYETQSHFKTFSSPFKRIITHRDQDGEGGSDFASRKEKYSVLFSTLQNRNEEKTKEGTKTTMNRKNRRSASRSASTSRNQNKRSKNGFNNVRVVKTYKQIKEEKQQIQALRNDINSSTFTNDKKMIQNHNNQIPHKSSPSPSTSTFETEKEPKIINNSQSFSHQQQQQHNVRQRIHKISTIKSSRTTEEQKRSSDRISKAQQLLQDFSMEPSLDVNNNADDNRSSGSEDIKTATTPSSSNSSKRTSKDSQKSKVSSTSSPSSKTAYDSKEENDESATTTSTKTVPDTYWYNGNLQQGKGDYVTRWSQGMKVAEPLRKYDPIAAEEILFRQPTKWVVRNIQIGFPLANWAIGVVWDITTSQEEVNRKKRAIQLLKTISGLGPAIIKGGQALASRSDLMPSEYLEELQKLQDDVPRFKNELAFATVEEELGVEFGEIFELIFDDPIAAASIGQVYKARLRTNGDIVALKIQRPKCEEVIALDLYVLRWWSGVANVLLKLLNRDIDVQSIIDDFGELIYRELDYVAEAANAQRFSELYANQVKDVFVPKVYSDLTTNKVLTMEWVDGFRLTDSDALDKYQLDRKKLVDTLVQCSLRQILGNGFFHADPHAGNLLVVPDGRLCYLDFGMMSYAAAPQRNGFLLAVVHIVNRDWDELVSMYQRLGFIPEGTDLKPIAVALEKTLPDALSSDVSELNFKNVVGKLGDIMYTYPFSLPPFYISIIRCLGVLEGLAIQVDPQARILSEAYPYVASRVLTDPQGELQEALRRLALTSDGKIRWNRLERLLSEARGSQEYDVSVAVNSLTDYLISDDGIQLLDDLADQIVDGTDSLSIETIGYVIEASRALAIRDEVAAVRAFRTLENLFQNRDDDVSTPAERLRDQLNSVLPEPTPTMKQFGRIALLLGARGSSSDPSKLLPIVRKLSQEPRIQRISSEVIARLGERMMSRSLRAMFGLPPPEHKSGR
mmetsp:Transcript_18161/g.22231  ORF Transcript_18161/g.22231 Transcript_18161/m.22231 type:complete len:1040 (+) Transcript_18161:205-3324(+)